MLLVIQVHGIGENDQGKYVYPCNQCDEKLETTTKIRHHLAIAHGQREMVPYECKRCKNPSSYIRFNKYKVNTFIPVTLLLLEMVVFPLHYLCHDRSTCW